MKKEIAIWTFFAAMLAASLINVLCLESLTERVSRATEQSVAAAVRGDWASSESFAESALSEWKSRDTHTQLVLRHSAIESAENAIILMLTEVYAKDAARVRGAAEAVLRSMESISESERIRFGSVF
ncbi:MAG: DUF4363 family protein [Oscillospiraceae bacterium]|jgi:hypothetical protein|nr:DUF4363 family protein [Oscillospiraceae bacterium]